MWTASVISTSLQSGQQIVAVSFVNANDSTQNFTDNVVCSSLTNFKAVIKSRLDALNGLATIAPGPIDTTPAVQTQADVDQAQFLTDWRNWQRVKLAIDAGILTGNETAVVNLKNKVISEFKPAYLSLL